MPRRNGPQERTSGFDALRERLPRSIALRLARAGLMAPGAPARQSEQSPAATGREQRDDHPTTSPTIFDR